MSVEERPGTTLPNVMADSMLAELEGVVQLHTRDDADPQSFAAVPVSKHFDDHGCTEFDLLVGSVADADKKPWSWRRAVLEWDGDSPWTDTNWPTPMVSERLCCYLSALHGEWPAAASCEVGAFL